MSTSEVSPDEKMNIAEEPQSGACAVAPEAAPKPSRGKKVAKYAGLTVLFGAIMLVLLMATSYVLHPKDNTEEAGMMDVRTYSVLAEPEQTVDALFVGNSIIATDIAPMEMWERAGVTSYVCAANGEKMTFVHYLLEQTFQKQSPKYVFLDADMFFDPSDFSHLAREILRETFPGILYHHRWSSLTIDDFTKPIRYTNILDAKGYNAKGRSFKLEPTDYMAETDASVGVSRINMVLMQDALDMCKANGAQLALIAMPMPTGWDRARHNGAQQIADQLGIEFIDLNLRYGKGGHDAKTDAKADAKPEAKADVKPDVKAEAKPEAKPEAGAADKGMQDIDWGTDARDEFSHLNYRGASKVTAYVCDLLVERGLADHRGDARFATWDTGLVSYKAYMEELRKNPEKYDAAGTHVG